MEFPRTEVGVKFDGGERDFWDVGGGGRRHAHITRAAQVAFPAYVEACGQGGVRFLTLPLFKVGEVFSRLSRAGGLVAVLFRKQSIDFGRQFCRLPDCTGKECDRTSVRQNLPLAKSDRVRKCPSCNA
jgi:hypothetical protein